MSLESSNTSRQYFPHINVLRGFAALTVFIYHIIELFGWSDFPVPLLYEWFHRGWMAVDLFFVISGFVIIWSLLKLRENQPNHLHFLKIFAVRRFVRIAPLYLLTLAAFTVLIVPHMLVTLDGWYHLAMHLIFAHPFTPETFGSINGANWSVAVEVQFYIAAIFSSFWWMKRSQLACCSCLFP